MKEQNFPNKFVKSLYQANSILGKIELIFSIVMLWLLIAVCVIFISCRFVFHISTPWADELARYFLIILAWIGGSYANSVGDHLEIDIVGTVIRKFAKNPDKVMAIIDRIGQVLVVCVMIFFTYYFAVYMGKISALGTSSTTMGFKMTLPMSFVLVGCILITLQTFIRVLLPHRYWNNHVEPEKKEEE